MKFLIIVQMKIDGYRFRSEDLAPLVQQLRDGAGRSCAAGVLVPDDRIVTWFGKRGGVPKQCG